MPLSESIPVFRPAQAVTCHANVSLTAGRCVAVVAEPTGDNPTVGLPTGAGARVFGVAAETRAAGDKIGVHVAPGQIVPVEAGTGGVALGPAQAAADGTVVTRTTGIVVGECVKSAAAGAEAWLRLAQSLI
jgi:hypothetical protein